MAEQFLRYSRQREILEENATADQIGLGQIYYGPTLTLNYNDPTVDPRTPDIIVTPNVGVVYSGSTEKLAKHAGSPMTTPTSFCCFRIPACSPARSARGVGTVQVAPTILKALGIDPWALLAVRVEGNERSSGACNSSKPSQKFGESTADVPVRASAVFLCQFSAGCLVF